MPLQPTWTWLFEKPGRMVCPSMLTRGASTDAPSSPGRPMRAMRLPSSSTSARVRAPARTSSTDPPVSSTRAMGAPPSWCGSSLLGPREPPGGHVVTRIELVHRHAAPGAIGLLARGDDAQGPQVVHARGVRVQAAGQDLLDDVGEELPSVIDQRLLPWQRHRLRRVRVAAAGDEEVGEHLALQQGAALAVGPPHEL